VHPDQALALLRAQLEELATLRNSNTRDAAFKHWRQNTLTVIQRIWEGDGSRASRFKRIPFSAPGGGRPDRDQVRTAFEKGCGEALSCLRAFVVEVGKDPRIGTMGAPALSGNAGETEELRIPLLDTPGLVKTPKSSRTPAASPGAEIPRLPRPADEGGDAAAGENEGSEMVREAMSDFLSTSPVFAALERAEKVKTAASRLSPSAFALAALAGEVSALGVPAMHRSRVRAALQGLARHIDAHDLTWDELRRAVNVLMEFPQLGRRSLPLLVPFLDAAA
jgi:hypothetical protein